MDTSRRVYIQNIVAGAVVAAVSAGMFAMTYAMPRRVAVFPRLGTAAVFGLGLLLAAVNFYRLRRGLPTDKKPVEASSFASPGWSTLIIVAYAAGIGVAGFYTATALAMMGFMYFLGQRSAKTILGVTALVTALVYFFFTTQLKLPLPQGLLY